MSIFKSFAAFSCFSIVSCSNHAAINVNVAPTSGTPAASWFDYVNRLMPAEEKNIGPFKNIYKGDPDLAGLEVYQKPYGDNAVEDYSDYLNNSRPGTINYHFWNGKIRSINYSTTGKIQSQYWDTHKIGKRESHGTYQSWEMVNFALGSDPNFTKHKDPRKPMPSL